MIDHISLGVKDLERSKRFYDAALQPLGYKCLRKAKALVGYGYSRDRVSLWVVSAERPVPPDSKSRPHICFAAPSAEAVGAFHAASLQAGGQDNGTPGFRPHYSADYYAAFIIDPDGTGSRCIMVQASHRMSLRTPQRHAARDLRD